VAAVPGTPGQLQVTVIAQTSAGVPINGLRRIEFAVPTNGVIDGFGRVGEAGAFAVDLPDQPRAVTFAVRRVDPAQATNVPFTVTDACGPWSTFVGGGPSAF